MKMVILTTFFIMSITALLSAQDNKTDELVISKIFNALEIGWNTKSGATFSSVFADVHDYIVVNGMYFFNWTKKDNEAAHQMLFDGVYKNSNIKLKVDRANFLRADLALVTAIGVGYPTGSPVPENPGVIMTVLAEKKNAEWKIISFHNHEFNAKELKQRSPMPLNVMYASWYKK